MAHCMTVDKGWTAGKALSFVNSAFLPRLHRNASVRFCKRTPDVSRRKYMLRCSAKGPEELDMGYEDLVSNDSHVVLSADQVSELMDRLGDDALSDDELDFLSLAEEYDSDQELQPTSKAKTNTVEYFTDENLDYMPNWAKDMYLSGTHSELEKDIGTSLHDIAAKNRGDEVDEHAKGIERCTVSDIAEDYCVPEEFVVDMMTALGVAEKRLSLPVRQACTAEQIEQMLTLLTSFDRGDLTERYSDYSVEELAESLECDVNLIIGACVDAGVVMWKGPDQRLLKSRETIIINMLQGGDKKKLPPLLEGLLNMQEASK